MLMHNSQVIPGNGTNLESHAVDKNRRIHHCKGPHNNQCQSSPSQQVHRDHSKSNSPLVMYSVFSYLANDSENIIDVIHIYSTILSFSFT